MLPRFGGCSNVRKQLCVIMLHRAGSVASHIHASSHGGCPRPPPRRREEIAALGSSAGCPRRKAAGDRKRALYQTRFGSRPLLPPGDAASVHLSSSAAAKRSPLRRVSHLQKPWRAESPHSKLLNSLTVPLAHDYPALLLEQDTARPHRPHPDRKSVV